MPVDICKLLFNYEQLAQAENKEVNAKRNNSWKDAKVDGKKIWDLID